MNETLTIRAIRTTAVEVPMKHVLGTSQAAVRAAPLLLIDLETEEGVTGRAYLFCYVRGAAAAMATMVAEVERRVRLLSAPLPTPAPQPVDRALLVNPDMRKGLET